MQVALLTPLLHTGIITALLTLALSPIPRLSCHCLRMVADPMFWTSHLGAALISLPRWPGLCAFLTCIPSQAEHPPRVLREGRTQLFDARQLLLVLRPILQLLPALCLPHTSRHPGHHPALPMTGDRSSRHPQSERDWEVGEWSGKNRDYNWREFVEGGGPSSSSPQHCNPSKPTCVLASQPLECLEASFHLL